MDGCSLNHLAVINLRKQRSYFCQQGESGPQVAI